MLRTAITEEYETTLHIATNAGQTALVSDMIDYMDPQDFDTARSKLMETLPSL